MAPRRRTKGKDHWPDYLTSENIKGKISFRFITIDGKKKRFPPGTTEAQAVQAANAYNIKYRSAGAFLLNKSDPYNKPLRDWLPAVIDSVKEEENLSENALSTFLNDCQRLNECLGHKPSKSINLEDLNTFLNRYYGDKSKNVYNRKVSFLKKVFAYLADKSAVERNIAESKKHKKMGATDKKSQRIDLDVEHYKVIYDAAPLFLKIAMSLSLQTTHAVKEIHRIKYRIKEPREGVCGIVWFDEMKLTENQAVWGTLYIHRHKTQHNKASFVAIPVTNEIKAIVDLSRTDNVACPYIVHKMNNSSNPTSKECTHRHQVTSKTISREFSAVRDQLGLFNDVESEKRPTFHSIRGLSARLIKKMGQNPQQRMAHSKEATTQIYINGNSTEWNEVAPLSIVV